jgi:hypothetical protein
VGSGLHFVTLTIFMKKIEQNEQVLFSL